MRASMPIGALTMAGLTAFACLNLPRAWTQEPSPAPAPTEPAAAAPETAKSEASTPLRVAVVNLKQVFSESARSKRFEAQLEKEKKAEEAELKSIVVRIEEIKEQIDALLKEGGKPALLKECRCQLIQLAALVKYREEDWNAEVNRRINAHTSTLFNDVSGTIEKVAHEHGFDLVLRAESAGPMDPASDESASDRIARRMILYANPAIDITQEVQGAFEPKIEEKKPNK